MSNACRIIVLLGMSALSSFALWAGDGADKARSLLLSRLRSDGFSLGYSAARKAVICDGVASAQYHAATDKARLTSVRQVLYSEASMKAKASLASFLRQNRSTWEQVIDRSADGSSMWRASAGSVLKSQKVLRGCMVRDSVEVQDDGFLFVAVAVEWGESLARDIHDVGRGGVELTSADLKFARAWLEKRGPLSCIGARFCTLADGFHFPIAVAAGDIDGKRALEIEVATKYDERMASAAFDSIFNTALIVDAREESFVQVSEAQEGRSVLATDTANRSILAVAVGASAVQRQIVLEDVIRDPETGHNVHVIAYGPRVGQKLR